MKPILTLIPLTLCACAAPVVATSSVEEDVQTENDSSPSEQTEEDTSSNEQQTEDEPSNTPDEPEQEDTEPEETETETDPSEWNSTYILDSSTWIVTGATMIEDSCEWDTPLRQFFGIGSDALLPESFSVEGFDGYFQIEANNYGAAGPITCGFIGTEFECETQSVTPLAFDLGTYGWTYAIDFTGEATSEGSLVGVAEVRFPTVSDWLIPIFQSMGMDYTQCVQSFDLSFTVN